MAALPMLSRRILRRAVSAALSAVLIPALATAAGARQADEIRIARLIRDLGSDSFVDRDRASEELASLGPATRRQLEQAVEDPDPEVRLRAKDLLKRIRVSELWLPARVHYQERDVSASEALAAIVRETGNRVLVGDQYGAFRDQRVTLDHGDSAFWEVVDDLCRRSGNRVRPHYDTRTPGLVLVSGALGKNPLAYAGPVRAMVTHARRVFTEELDYEQLEAERSHTFQLDLQAMWEYRFRLVAYRSQPELVEAVTAGGAALAAAQATSGGWNIAGPGTRQVALSLRLHPPATTAGSIDTLKLKWGLIAVGDLATIEVADPYSTEPHFQDDVELVVENFQQGPGARCELTLVVVRDLVVPEPQELLFQENEVELFDAQGRAFHKQGQTNSLGERGAVSKLTFTGDSGDSVPKLLRFSYPRIRSQKDLEIVFHDVPLPTSRPE
ncbi:MAG TPA: hypothetical protein VMV69_29970 [Pirellulales bacterium]|nr:hypothetical protein [Pirellulales bacterium]